MKLCKKCNSLMNPINGNSFKCIKCGYKEKGKDLIEIEKIPKNKIVKEGIISDEKFAKLDVKTNF